MSMKNSYIGQAWLVIALSVCFAAALAAVEAQLGQRIKDNKLAATREQIPLLVPGAKDSRPYRSGAGQTVYKALDGDHGHVGWVVPATGQGFADKIELLVGLDADAKVIRGVYILDQKETPGLGNKITGEKFLKWFRRQDALRPLKVVKRGAVPGQSRVEAVTGATISSTSVCDIVNRAVVEFRKVEWLPGNSHDE